MPADRCRVGALFSGVPHFYQRDTEQKRNGNWVAIPFFVPDPKQAVSMSEVMARHFITKLQGLGMKNLWLEDCRDGRRIEIESPAQPQSGVDNRTTAAATLDDANSPDASGFVSLYPPGSGRRAPGLHFGVRDIRPDWKGSTAHVWVQGTPVSFVKIQRPSKKFGGGMWTSASDVCPQFVEEPSESLETYSETGRVRSWNGCFGDLQRECGDTLFLHRSSVADRFKHLLINLSVGDYVYHRVGKRDDVHRWHAIDIELFSEVEQARLQRGLPAQQPEPVLVAATPETEPVPEVLAPTNRLKTLRQLALEKRVGHEFSQKGQTKS